MANNYIASRAIRGYQYDLDTGVALSKVVVHAEALIARLKRIGTVGTIAAAEQIEDWLNALVNR